MAILLLALLVMVSCGEKKKSPPEKKPVRVEVTRVLSQTLPIYLEAIGHFTPYNTVEIKAQVEGVLEELHFIEGQKVAENDKLFTIDPRPYEAKKLKVLAEMKENIANLKFAEEKVERYANLVDQNYVSKLNYDEYVTNAEVLSAAILKNEAELALADINLNYCFIHSPIPGYTSKRLVDRGNLIVNDGKAMITINQISPLFIDFSVSERDFFRILKYQKEGALKVEARVSGYEDGSFMGELTLIDNHINQKTGMIPLRAILPNSNEVLWPGQFVKARMLLFEKQDALLVPQDAVNIGPKGRYVWVVGKDLRVHMAYITTGEELDGQIEILHGVEAGQTIVRNGQLTLRTDDEVTIVNHDF